MLYEYNYFNTIFTLHNQLHHKRNMEAIQALMSLINEWERATFPGQTALGKAEHLKKEVEELCVELEKDLTSDDCKTEVADCFILLLNIAARTGMDAAELLSVIDRKMIINKNRKWGKINSMGFATHIEE